MLGSQYARSIVATLLAATAWPALAQTGSVEAGANESAPQSADASAANSSNVTDIIVTAQRRSEALQRVPVAVSVVTADVLAKRNVTTESDLQFTTPGLQVRTGSSATQVNYAVRGQSYDQFSGTRPGVLPYFNEVQASSSIGGGGGTTAFYDLDSVQLLKGPQGTLFGRTATGGAVLFTTAKPGNSIGGYGAVRVGNYSTEQAEGAINLPIIADTLLTRVAGFYSNNRGYQTNLQDGSHPGSETRYGLRGSVTLKSGAFRNDLVVDYYHSKGSSVTAVLNDLVPGGLASIFYSPSFPGYASYVAAQNNPYIDPNGIASYLATQKARGPYVIASDAVNIYRSENLVVTNATTIDISGSLVLRNIFGYSHFKSVLANDSDGSPYGIAGSKIVNGVPQQQDGTSSALSNELQLQGNLPSLKYTVGLYYSDEKATVYRPSSFLDILGVPVTYSNDRNEHRTLAGFAQGTYQLGDVTGIEGLGVTGGFRYTSERIRAITLPQDSVYGLAIANPTLYSNNQQRTINNVSWTVGLQDQVTQDLLLYVSARRSYRNGGFNSDQAPQNGFGETGGNSYRTETVTDLELGAKYQGRWGNVPVRANIALFNDWLKNSQRTAFATIAGNPAAVTVNVPRGKATGVEFDSSISPSDWLNIGGSINYINARFTKQDVFIAGVPGRFATYPDTSKWSGSVFAEATAPIGGDLSASLRGDLFAQSFAYYSGSAQNNPGARLPGYSIANFRVSVQDVKAGWTVSGLLKNAFNKTFYTGGLALGETIGFNTAVPGAPRSFIVEARLKF